MRLCQIFADPVTYSNSLIVAQFFQSSCCLLSWVKHLFTNLVLIYITFHVVFRLIGQCWWLEKWGSLSTGCWSTASSKSLAEKPGAMIKHSVKVTAEYRVGVFWRRVLQYLLQKWCSWQGWGKLEWAQICINLYKAAQ